MRHYLAMQIVCDWPIEYIAKITGNAPESIRPFLRTFSNRPQRPTVRFSLPSRQYPKLNAKRDICGTVCGSSSSKRAGP
jgi:hypothetical protein